MKYIVLTSNMDDYFGTMVVGPFKTTSKAIEWTREYFDYERQRYKGEWNHPVIDETGGQLENDRSEYIAADIVFMTAPGGFI